MKRYLLLLAVLLSLSAVAYAQESAPPPHLVNRAQMLADPNLAVQSDLSLRLTVRTVDSTVIGKGITQLVFPNGSLAITGKIGTVTFSGGGGSGDVVGPSSSTDNAVARFDATTGKLLQNSVVTIGDTGNVAGVGTLNTHTIPGGTDTFTLNAAAQSLTNKKLGSLTSNGFVKTTGGDGTLSVDTATYLTGNQTISFAPTGDVTGSTTGATTLAPALTIGAGKVTNAMLAQVTTATFKGRTTAGTGNVEDLTATQATALLNAFAGDSGSGGTKGLVPAPASGDAAASKFLKADGTWQTVSGTGANTALSNLASVAVNLALTPGTDNSIALGSASKRWTDAFLSGGIKGANGYVAKFVDVSSSASYFQFTNTASTGTTSDSKLILEPDGTDANISIHFKAKGTGATTSGQTYFNVSSRYDRPAISFWDSNFGYLTNYGIGMKSGGSYISMNATNLMLGAGDGTTGKLVQIGGGANLVWHAGTSTAEDCPPCAVVGFTKASAAVIGLIASPTTADDTFPNGATLAMTANTPAQITANQNDYNPSIASYFQRWSTDASRNVTGLTFAVTQVAGQMHRIWNVGTNNLVLVNDDGSSSTAANRFLTSTGSNLTIATKECADVQYDTTVSRWRATPCAAAASGGSGTVNSGTAKRLAYYASTGTTVSDATGFEYQSGASPNVGITAQNAAHVPLRLISATSPSANVFEASADNGTTTHFLITNAGAPSAPGSGSSSERYGSGSALSNATSSVAVGNSAQMSVGSSNGVVMGQGATLSGSNGVLIGQGGFASANSSVTIGQNTTGAASGITLGKDASGASNSFVAGSSGTAMTNVYFGKGVTNTAATAYTINGVGGSGSNNTGAALQLAGGIGTGNVASVGINFLTSDPGSTGSTAQTLTTKMALSGGGTLAVTPLAPAANTTYDGLTLTNSTTATTGNESFAPGILFDGQGFRTTSTAASRRTKFRVDLQPLDGTTNPVDRLVFSQEVNLAGTFTTHTVLGVAQDGTQYAVLPGGSETGWPGLALGVNFGSQASPVIDGLYSTNGGSHLILRPANRVGVHGSGVSLVSGATLAFNNNASSIPTGTDDTFIKRGGAAATLQFGAADLNGASVAQILRVQNGITGTDVAPAASFTIRGPLGTGNTTPGYITLQGGARNTASGTTAHTAIDRLIVGPTKVLTNNTATTVTNVTVASGSVAGGVLHYGIEVQDGTDFQFEEGEISFHVSNKGGTIANNVTSKSLNQQLATAGTLTVTWTISAANPALLQVNANSSLTPSTGFPRLVYAVMNLGNQAVAVQ